MPDGQERPRVSDTTERLPCGCVVATVGDAFVMRPCSLGCEYYLFAVAETKRQDKPLVLGIIDNV